MSTSQGPLEPPATWAVVWRLMRLDPRRYAATALFWILWHAWALLPGLLAAAFFGALQHRGPFGWGITAVAGLAAGAGLLRAALMMLAVRFGVPLHFRTRARLQHGLLRAVLAQPGSAAASAPGRMLSTFRDDAEHLALAIDWPFDALAGLVFWGVGIGILWTVSRPLTLLVFLPLVAVVALAQWARTRLTRFMQSRRTSTSRVTDFLWDVWAGRGLVVASGAGPAALRRLGRLNADRRAAELQDQRWILAMDAAFGGAAQLGAGLLLLAAAAGLRQGTLSVGAFALFATYLVQVAHYISFVGYLLDSSRNAGVAVQRLAASAPKASAFPRRDPAPLAAALPLPPLSELSAVIAAGTPPRILQLKVRAGSLTVITGPVASGKSTLLRCLLGLDAAGRPAAQVTWNGVWVAPHDLRPPQVAYVPEGPHFLSGTLEDNLTWGQSKNPGAMEAALAAAALDPAAVRLEAPVGAGGQALSGGQATRVGLARALMNRPALLIADSLAHALDAGTEARLWDNLRQQGMAILAVSVRPETLAGADTVIDLSRHP